MMKVVVMTLSHKTLIPVYRLICFYHHYYNSIFCTFYLDEDYSYHFQSSKTSRLQTISVR